MGIWPALVVASPSQSHAARRNMSTHEDQRLQLMGENYKWGEGSELLFARLSVNANPCKWSASPMRPRLNGLRSPDTGDSDARPRDTCPVLTAQIRGLTYCGSRERVA